MLSTTFVAGAWGKWLGRLRDNEGRLRRVEEAMRRVTSAIAASRGRHTHPSRANEVAEATLRIVAAQTAMAAARRSPRRRTSGRSRRRSVGAVAREVARARGSVSDTVGWGAHAPRADRERFDD